jgi:hypothetical protein
METKHIRNRCRARTKAGKPCLAAATAGGLCFFHANPNKASELGRIGGRKNRHVVADEATAFAPLETAIAVRNAVSRLIADVHSGKVHPKVASSLAQLLSLQLRTIETSELERQLQELKKQPGEAPSEESLNLNRELSELDCGDSDRKHPDIGKA